MLGTIERIKNSVLLKCNTLNDELIKKDLIMVIDSGIYHFAEEMISMISDYNLNIDEKKLREDISNIISTPIIKKIKRKLFIDSLALQITNDYFIESYINKEIDLKKLSKSYLKELKDNENSNQLNMTEDLNIEPIIENVRIYVGKNIISPIKENEFLVSAVNELVRKTKEELEINLEKLIDSVDLKYKDILINELKEEEKDDIINEEEGEDSDMVNSLNEEALKDSMEENNKYDKYDDMTLYNKVVLSLNTKEEKLTRQENKVRIKEKEIDELLSSTNKSIEANIERENLLSRRKMDLNAREVELNSKLSEAEVIFLNMKPLIKGLSKISASDMKVGDYNE